MHLFVHLLLYLSYEVSEREKGSFHLLVHSSARAFSEWLWSQGLHPDFLHRCRGPNTWAISHWFPRCISKGVGHEVEQRVLKPASILHACISGGSLISLPQHSFSPSTTLNVYTSYIEYHKQDKNDMCLLVFGFCLLVFDMCGLVFGVCNMFSSFLIVFFFKNQEYILFYG